ncbi:cation:proton antiporter [Companilactobacillus baiquanensis]|uniref:Cation:proton antiporter n=1 Tax=Companilactobacillus baiquanensis TaxID=2486005 RepID=A0ABW1UUC6_9LACO|nr:sodium:proton antiporter [Companilactobacillus baiquanensis]
MSLFFGIMIMLLAVVPAQMLFQRFPKVPLAFYQIGIGLLLSFFPLYSDFEFPPEVFLLVVISTLMFSDSRKINLGEFSYSLRPTLSLAINLVIMSILIVGALAHFITPALTWFGGFMLAAILSPTDAVAYKSITAAVELPAGVDSALENESLLNDASGLVAFNLAAATLATGHFSVVQGVGNFLYVFIGGIVMGFLLGWVFMFSRRLMITHEMNINAVIVPYILAVPYIIYFVAEELGMSGILAVVAAGLLRTWEQKNWQLTTARIQDATFSIENIISEVLNGLVFVILGINLPKIIRQSFDVHVHFGLLLLIALSLYLTLGILRFIWFYFRMVKINESPNDNHLINSLLASVNGVHGTVTLMMALSIPTTLKSVPTNLRAAIILITVMVIMLSMLIPIFITPLLLPTMDKKILEDSEKFWNQMVDDMLISVRDSELDPYIKNYVTPILVTQRRLLGMNQKKLNSLYRQTLKIEKQATDELIKAGKISKQVATFHSDVVVRDVLNQPLRPWNALIYWIKVLISSHSRVESTESQREIERAIIEDEVYLPIMNFLNQRDSTHKQVEINTLARIYSTRHDEVISEEMINIERYHVLQLFKQEMDYMREMYLNEEITLQQSRTFMYDISLQQTIYIKRHFSE